MRFSTTLTAFLLAAFLFRSTYAKAQTTYPDPVSYMAAISKVLDAIQANMWSYTNAAAHNKNVKKIEKKRLEIIESIKEAKTFVWKMPSYKGDKAFKDSAYSFLKISYAVINEDYAKLVDMEEVAEQSYDAMEAYLLAKQLALDKQDSSLRMFSNEYKLFAARNNVTLTESKDETAKKLEAAGKVYDYYNKIYLIFFKSFKQEAYVMGALDKSDISSLKQNSDALAKYSADGIQKIDEQTSFNNDPMLKSACKEALTFYKSEAEKNLPGLADFLVKKETFEKIKKSIDAKPASKRTQADVDTYNAAVKDFNTATTAFNTNIQKINEGRSKILTKWNETVSTFIDKHVPKN